MESAKAPSHRPLLHAGRGTVLLLLALVGFGLIGLNLSMYDAREESLKQIDRLRVSLDQAMQRNARVRHVVCAEARDFLRRMPSADAPEVRLAASGRAQRPESSMLDTIARECRAFPLGRAAVEAKPVRHWHPGAHTTDESPALVPLG